jgi:hypothetical protein
MMMKVDKDLSLCINADRKEQRMKREKVIDDNM